MKHFTVSPALADIDEMIYRCERIRVLLPASRRYLTPHCLLAFQCTKITSSFMTSITTSTSEVASAHSHPEVASLATTNYPSESKALPNAHRVKTRVTRRQGKRDGSFQLQFVTATDLSQFKDGETRRSVRLQVMTYHRNKPNKETKTTQNRPETVPSHSAEPMAKSANTQAQLFAPKPIPSTSGALVCYAHEQQIDIHASTRTRSPLGANEGSPRDAESDHISERCCFQCSLVFEADPLPAFMSWQMGKYSRPDDDVAIPESPLFCPRPNFVTILKDERCSPSIHGLLRDMRDLTDLFLSHNIILEVPSDTDEIRPAFSCSADVDYNATVAGLRDQLTNLLPASIPGHPDSGDWV
jgi:hypothetical protein